MKKSFKNIAFIFGLFSLLIACDDDIDPIITELETDRAFAPVNLTARVRNMTTLELSWLVNENVDSYVVEFSEDSLEFNSIIRTVTVLPDELPLQENFEGETRYSARVKSVVEGQAESKWATVTVMTAIENILESLPGENITSNSVTLNWPAGSDVTHFLVNPGNMERTITADEIEAGEATIEGLTSETEYTVTLYNNAKRRGVVSFETLVDIGDATPVYPEDDFAAIVAEAANGDVLALFPGDYLDLGAITIDKSITIRAVYPFDKPILHGSFDLENGAQEVEIRDLELTGDNNITTVFDMSSAGVVYGSLTLSGCVIRDYTRQLVYGNGDLSTIQSISIDNCMVENFITSGGEFLDFRKSHISNLTITNSTFVDVAQGRHFIRIDASGLSGTGLTTNVLIDHSTFYKVATGGNRILYVRFDANELEVRNSLFAETDAIYSNQSTTDYPDFINNNYFNADNLINGDHGDTGGSSLDPGFVDAGNGDFTITNQTLLDNEVGDPRWRQ